MASAPTDGRVLLVRASPRSGTPGVWSLPGGAVDHGEHPNDTVVRETAAETGLSVAVARLRDVLADMRALPHRGVTIHTDRLIYAVTVRGGTLRDRVDQPTDLARWYTPEEARELPLRPFTARALGLPAASADLRARRAAGLPVLLRRTRARTGCTARSASRPTPSPPTRAAGCC